jgi:hypothetical protein
MVKRRRRKGVGMAILLRLFCEARDGGMIKVGEGYRL